MRDHPLAAVVVAFVALVVVVGAIIVVSAIDVTAVGLRVNGHEASQQSIDDELRDFADSPVFANSFAQSGIRLKTTKGAINSIATAQWLAFRVQKSLAEQVLARRSIAVTRTDVDKARSALAKSGALNGLSGAAATQLAGYQAAVTKLIKTLGSPSAAAAAVRKDARKANVSIDPRYGTWNARRVGICPTTGCRQFVSALPSAQQ